MLKMRIEGRLRMLSHLEQEKANHLLFNHGNVHIRNRPDCHHDSDVTDQMVQIGETQQISSEHNQLLNSKQTGKQIIYAVLPVVEKQVASIFCGNKLSFKSHSCKLQGHNCMCPWHTGILQDKKQWDHKPNLLHGDRQFTYYVYEPLSINNLSSFCCESISYLSASTSNVDWSS